MESSDASIIANVDVTSDTSNNMDKAEDSTSTSTASVPAVTEPEDWMSELQRLAAASVTWADWQLPDECDVSVPEDLLHRIDFKKPVSLIALQNELAEWEADIAKATAESENQSQPDPDDLVPLDELSEKMEKLVSELDGSAGSDEAAGRLPAPTGHDVTGCHVSEPGRRIGGQSVQLDANTAAVQHREEGGSFRSQ